MDKRLLGGPDRHPRHLQIEQYDLEASSIRFRSVTSRTAAIGSRPSPLVKGLNLPVVIGAPDEASVRVYVDPAASVKALARRCLEWTRAIFDRKRSVPRGKDVTLPLSE